MRIIILFLIFQLFNASFASYYVNTDFFSKFNDSNLEYYIQKALLNNHELKQANHKVAQYRSEIQSVFSKEFPSLSVASNYLGSHFPRGDRNFLINSNSFILPFKVSYEPDFLLKTKDKINLQKHLYKAQIQNQRKTYLSLLADVASTYVNIMLFDSLIEKQKEIIKNKTQNLISNKKKFDFGVVDLINLNKSEEETYIQESIFDNLIKNQNTILYNFAVLIGESAENINEIKRGKLEAFEYQETIPNIICSDIIYQRPDVIEAQEKLKSAKLDITIAKKDFFPTFNINGFLAFDTAGMGNFFSWNSSFAYLIAGATQDIFKGGAKIANLKIKKEKFNELLENFKQVDLVAIKEINNALNIIKQDKLSEKSLLKQVLLERNILNSSEKKFKRGSISKLDYLDDKNSLLQQEALFANAKATRLIDYFTLYKALGGEI